MPLPGRTHLRRLQGAPKDELLPPFYVPAGLPADFWEIHPLVEEVRPAAEIRGSGYVVASLEAALWAFARSNTFTEGALLAVNLGEDADTTGAVYGQLAGTFYGQSGIPAPWLDKLHDREMIAALADRLLAHARVPGS